MLKQLVKRSLMVLLPPCLLRRHYSRRQRCLYLTFDDGPTAGVTDRLLALLQQYQVQATFFVIGKKLEQQPQLAQQIVDQGHLLANHSYSHPQFQRLTVAQQWDQVWQAQRLIEPFTRAQSAQFFRAPRGLWRLLLLIRLWREGMVCVHWSRDSLDYSQHSAQQIIALLQQQPPRGGDILLFHDDTDKALEVLSVLLPQWQAKGFVFAGLRAC